MTNSITKLPPLGRFIVIWMTAIAFISNSIIPAYAQSVLSLPNPGSRVALSPAFQPITLKGVKINPDNPFQFEFVVDEGDGGPSDVPRPTSDVLRNESLRLIKYFLASLTTPENDMWVNLSPYEKDRIIPDAFGKTEMGRDLLAEDYLLKQITASLIYPEEELGKKFWGKVYKEAYEKYGTAEVPVNTFNKVWILPDKAVVFERDQTAFVAETHLKVMLEEDYIAMSHQKSTVNAQPSTKSTLTDDLMPVESNGVNALGAKILRDIIIPALEEEVNRGKNFAHLRQVYHSLILAAWYKRTLKNSILQKMYVDQRKTAGVDLKSTGQQKSTSQPSIVNGQLTDDPLTDHPLIDHPSTDDVPTADLLTVDKVYQQYLAAFKTGVYNYIKEDYDPVADEVIPRKYFSGGIPLMKINQTMLVTQDIQVIKKASSRWTNVFSLVVALSVAGTPNDALAKKFNVQQAAMANTLSRDNIKSPKKSTVAESDRAMLGDVNPALPFAEHPAFADFVLRVLKSRYTSWGLPEDLAERITATIQEYAQNPDEVRRQLYANVTTFDKDETWNAAYRRYKEGTKYQSTYEEIRPFLGTLPSGSRILDVGSGQNDLGKLIAQANPQLEVIGVDPYFDDNTQAPTQLSNLKFIKQQDSIHLPLQIADHSIDVVTFNAVLHHVKTADLRLLLQEVKRVLKPVGKVIAVEDTYSLEQEFPADADQDMTREFIEKVRQFGPQFAQDYFRFIDWYGNIVVHYWDGMALNYEFHSMEEWGELFKENGFDLSASQYYGFPAKSFHKPSLGVLSFVKLDRAMLVPIVRLGTGALPRASDFQTFLAVEDLHIEKLRKEGKMRIDSPQPNILIIGGTNSEVRMINGHFPSANIRVIGVNQDPLDNIAKDALENDSLSARLKLFLGDAAKLDPKKNQDDNGELQQYFSDASYDFIVARGIDPSAFLGSSASKGAEIISGIVTETMRLLKPGGYVLWDDFDAHDIYSKYLNNKDLIDIEGGGSALLAQKSSLIDRAMLGEPKELAKIDQNEFDKAMLVNTKLAGFVAELTKPYEDKDSKLLNIPSEQGETRLVEAIEKAIPIWLADLSADLDRLEISHPVLDSTQVAFGITGSASYLRDPQTKQVFWPAVNDLDITVYYPNEWEASIMSPSFAFGRLRVALKTILGDRGLDLNLFPEKYLTSFSEDKLPFLPKFFHPSQFYFGSKKMIESAESEVRNHLVDFSIISVWQYNKLLEKAQPFPMLQSFKSLMELARMRGDTPEVERLYNAIVQLTNDPDSMPIAEQQDIRYLAFQKAELFSTTKELVQAPRDDRAMLTTPARQELRKASMNVDEEFAWVLVDAIRDGVIENRLDGPSILSQKAILFGRWLDQPGNINKSLHVRALKVLKDAQMIQPLVDNDISAGLWQIRPESLNSDALALFHDLHERRVQKVKRAMTYHEPASAQQELAFAIWKGRQEGLDITSFDKFESLKDRLEQYWLDEAGDVNNHLYQAANALLGQIQAPSTENDHIVRQRIQEAWQQTRESELQRFKSLEISDDVTQVMESLQSGGRVPRDFWSDPANIQQAIVWVLDRLEGFKDARKVGNIRTMAEIYRQYVLSFQSQKSTNGQLSFFMEKGRLTGLMTGGSPFFDKKNSPAGLLRFALPGLIDEDAEGALRPWEVEHIWNDPRLAKKAIFEVLDKLEGFKDARRAGDIRAMAKIYRDKVMMPSSENGISPQAYFQEINGLKGLMRHERAFLDQWGSAALLRFALPGLIDEDAEGALRPWEVEQVWNDPRLAKKAILEALDLLEGFKNARLAPVPDIKTMAQIYRQKVIAYPRLTGGRSGPHIYFDKVGKLSGLMIEKRTFLDTTNSPDALLRFALPELVDQSNPDALRAAELARPYIRRGSSNEKDQAMLGQTDSDGRTIKATDEDIDIYLQQVSERVMAQKGYKFQLRPRQLQGWISFYKNDWPGMKQEHAYATELTDDEVFGEIFLDVLLEGEKDVLRDARVPNGEEVAGIRKALLVLEGQLRQWGVNTDLLSTRVFMVDRFPGNTDGAQSLGQYLHFNNILVLHSGLDEEKLSLVLIHEMWHRLSVGLVDMWLDEGITQYLTIKTMMNAGLIEQPPELLSGVDSPELEQLLEYQSIGPVSRYILSQAIDNSFRIHPDVNNATFTNHTIYPLFVIVTEHMVDKILPEINVSFIEFLNAYRQGKPDGVFPERDVSEMFAKIMDTVKGNNFIESWGILLNAATKGLDEFASHTKKIASMKRYVKEMMAHTDAVAEVFGRRLSLIKDVYKKGEADSALNIEQELEFIKKTADEEIRNLDKWHEERVKNIDSPDHIDINIVADQAGDKAMMATEVGGSDRAMMGEELAKIDAAYEEYRSKESEFFIQQSRPGNLNDIFMKLAEDAPDTMYSLTAEDSDIIRSLQDQIINSFRFEVGIFRIRGTKTWIFIRGTEGRAWGDRTSERYRSGFPYDIFDVLIHNHFDDGFFPVPSDGDLMFDLQRQLRNSKLYIRGAKGLTLYSGYRLAETDTSFYDNTERLDGVLTQERNIRKMAQQELGSIAEGTMIVHAALRKFYMAAYDAFIRSKQLTLEYLFWDKVLFPQPASFQLSEQIQSNDSEKRFAALRNLFYLIKQNPLLGDILINFKDDADERLQIEVLRWVRENDHIVNASKIINIFEGSRFLIVSALASAMNHSNDYSALVDSKQFEQLLSSQEVINELDEYRLWRLFTYFHGLSGMILSATRISRELAQKAGPSLMNIFLQRLDKKTADAFRQRWGVSSDTGQEIVGNEMKDTREETKDKQDRAMLVVPWSPENWMTLQSNVSGFNSTDRYGEVTGLENIRTLINKKEHDYQLQHIDFTDFQVEPIIAKDVFSILQEEELEWMIKKLPGVVNIVVMNEGAEAIRVFDRTVAIHKALIESLRNEPALIQKIIMRTLLMTAFRAFLSQGQTLRPWERKIDVLEHEWLHAQVTPENIMQALRKTLDSQITSSSTEELLYWDQAYQTKSQLDQFMDMLIKKDILQGAKQWAVSFKSGALIINSVDADGASREQRIPMNNRWLRTLYAGAFRGAEPGSVWSTTWGTLKINFDSPVVQELLQMLDQIPPEEFINPQIPDSPSVDATVTFTVERDSEGLLGKKVLITKAESDEKTKDFYLQKRYTFDEIHESLNINSTAWRFKKESDELIWKKILRETMISDAADEEKHRIIVDAFRRLTEGVQHNWERGEWTTSYRTDSIATINEVKRRSLNDPDYSFEDDLFKMISGTDRAMMGDENKRGDGQATKDVEDRVINSWAWPIQRMLKSGYQFLPEKVEGNGFVYRGVREGIIDGLISREFSFQSSNSPSTDKDPSERELGLFYLSQWLGEAIRYTHEANPDDSGVIVLTGNYFNTEITQGRAAVHANIDGLYHFPFLTQAPKLKNAAYLIVHPSLKNYLDQVKSGVRALTQKELALQKTLLSESAPTIIALPENHDQMPYSQVKKYILEQLNIDLPDNKFITSDVHPTLDSRDEGRGTKDAEDRTKLAESQPAQQTEIKNWVESEGAINGIPSVDDMYGLAGRLSVPIYMGKILENPAGIFLISGIGITQYLRWRKKGPSADQISEMQKSSGGGQYWNLINIKRNADVLSLSEQEFLALGGIKNVTQFVVLDSKLSSNRHRTLFEEVIHALEETSGYSHESVWYVREVINDVIQMVFFTDKELRNSFGSSYSRLSAERRVLLKNALLKGNLDPNTQLVEILNRLKGFIVQGETNSVRQALFATAEDYLGQGLSQEELVSIVTEYVDALSKSSFLSSGEKLFPNYVVSKSDNALLGSLDDKKVGGMDQAMMGNEEMRGEGRGTKGKGGRATLGQGEAMMAKVIEMVERIDLYDQWDLGAVQLMNEIGIKPGQRLLSVGPGLNVGHLLFGALMGAQVDVNQPEIYAPIPGSLGTSHLKMLEFSLKKILDWNSLSLNINTHAYPIPIQEAKIPSSLYDSVVALNVLDGVEPREAKEIIKEIIRILKNDGTVILSDVSTGLASQIEEFKEQISAIKGNIEKIGSPNSDVVALRVHKDVAMLVDEDKQKLGGIDFNADKIHLEVDGDGNEIQFNFDPKEFENMKVDGFVPVILNITPITDLPLFLGLDNETPSVREVTLYNVLNFLHV